MLRKFVAVLVGRVTEWHTVGGLVLGLSHVQPKFFFYHFSYFSLKGKGNVFYMATYSVHIHCPNIYLDIYVDCLCIVCLSVMKSHENKFPVFLVCQRLVIA